MTEKTLTVTENGKYKNIDAYSIDNGDTFVVEKRFADARRIDMPAKGDKAPYCFFSAAVIHNGQEVSFVIKKQPEADAFNACGGIGDKLVVKLNKEMYKDKKKVDRVKNTLSFTKL